MKTAVKVKSISTSGPELWGLEVWGLDPQCGKSMILALAKIAYVVRFEVMNNVLKFGAKKNLQILRKSTLKF